MSLDSIIEAVVAGLLVITCVYCLVLSRRLKKLRDGQTELLAVIEKFDKASQRAEANLEEIRAAGAIIGRDLNGAMARAGGVLDELSVMVTAGDRIAGRIETAIGEVRAVGARRRDDANGEAA